MIGNPTFLYASTNKVYGQLEHYEYGGINDRYVIKDLNSTSGTFLNNKKVPNGVLYSGDIILLANIPIMFVDESTSISANAEEPTGKLRD